MKKDRKIMHISIIILLVVVTGLSIAYAALRTNINVTFGKVTQRAITWDVGFQEGEVTGEAYGTSGTGRNCGKVTLSKDTITIDSTTVSKPEDRCSYKLTVENYGGIVAKLDSITPRAPNNVECGFQQESKMVCGNITYQLSTDIDGKNILKTNQSIGINQIQTVYLNISYTGNTLSDKVNTQSRGGFTLNYVHG